jgi:cAMP-dependent protein kinase regulator
MIKDGVVSIDDVGEKFKAHKLGAGDYFGERALMTNEPRAATVRADTKVTVMALDKVAFHKLLGPLQEVCTPSHHTGCGDSNVLLLLGAGL